MERATESSRFEKFVETELMTLDKKNGRVPDESAKNKILTTSQWRRPQVLTITVMKEIVLEGRVSSVNVLVKINLVSISESVVR